MLKPSVIVDIPSRIGSNKFYRGVVECFDCGRKMYQVVLNPLYKTKREALENAKWHVNNW